MFNLGYEDAFLKLKGGYWTAAEIEQQPDMIRQTQAILNAGADPLNSFLAPLLANKALRIVLMGAGTSAFIGDCVAAHLSHHLSRRVDAIATTDLAAAPRYYLEKNTPTLFISFGRSGNSPESVAAIELADTLVSDTHHLAITCNEDGSLYKKINNSANGHVLLLPPETHDQGFAMTSSFTSMLYAVIAAFDNPATRNNRVDAITTAMTAVLKNYAADMRAIATKSFERVVYLGSHCFKGLAREASLKLLELTDGAVIATHDTPMGFRHGPKTIVNGATLVVIFLSNDPYTRRYDLDLLEELRRDGRAAMVLVIAAQPYRTLPREHFVLLEGMETAPDIELLLPYIMAPQMLALHLSLALGLLPDTPNATGAVNRVVQGVNIHAHL